MSEKNFNGRIVQKHDTEVNWNKAINFIPKIGEIIIYDPDDNYTYSRFKIGDGVNYVTDLPIYALDYDQGQDIIRELPLLKYVEQDLTDYQKLVSRENIGAGTSNFSGSYLDLLDLPEIATREEILALED